MPFAAFELLQVWWLVLLEFAAELTWSHSVLDLTTLKYVRSQPSRRTRQDYRFTTQKQRRGGSLRSRGWDDL